MNINNISYSSPVKYKVAATKSVDSYKLKNNSEDKFVYSDNKSKLKYYFYFKDTGRFDVDDYKKLSEDDKKYFRTICKKNDSLTEAAKWTVPIAIRLKKYLDKKYGKSDYVFGCIGTSPAMIAKALEFMGEKVKYLPVSNLKFISNESFDSFYDDVSDKRRESYKNFLISQGITDDIINSGSADYIFCDYTYSGDSLEIFKNLMREAFDVTSKKAKFRSLNRMIAISDLSSIKNILDDKEYIFRYFTRSCAALYGGISHLPFDQLDKINEVINYNTFKANKFNFMLIDELNKLGYIN